MALRITEPKLFLDTKNDVGRSAFKQVERLRVRHNVWKRGKGVDMVWHHSKVMDFYPVLCCRLSDCSSNKIFILKLLHHLITVFWAPIKMPKVQADFVAEMV